MRLRSFDIGLGNLDEDDVPAPWHRVIRAARPRNVAQRRAMDRCRAIDAGNHVVY